MVEGGVQMSAADGDKPKKVPFMNYLSCGHRGCAGCAEATGVRQVLDAAGPNTIVTVVTGCLEVMTTGYPETAWKVPLIHTAFNSPHYPVQTLEAGLKNFLIDRGGNGIAEPPLIHSHQQAEVVRFALEEVEISLCQLPELLVSR